jgi:hypothetical protein
MKNTLQITFEELAIGEWFSWTDPNHPKANGFIHPNVKKSATGFATLKGMNLKASSGKAVVFTL